MYNNWYNPNQNQNQNQNPYPNPNQNQNPYRQPNWQEQGWDNNMNYNNNNNGPGPHYYRRITIEESIAIALEQVPGQVVKVEMDTEKGVQVYEVDIVTAQGVKYEVAVDINTGGIVEIEID